MGLLVIISVVLFGFLVSKIPYSISDRLAYGLRAMIVWPFTWAFFWIGYVASELQPSRSSEESATFWWLLHWRIYQRAMNVSASLQFWAEADGPRLGRWFPWCARSSDDGEV